jgi:hypothetical protein
MDASFVGHVKRSMRTSWSSGNSSGHRSRGDSGGSAGARVVVAVPPVGLDLDGLAEAGRIDHLSAAEVERDVVNAGRGGGAGRAVEDEVARQ